jgi:hypothetical protein
MRTGQCAPCAAEECLLVLMLTVKTHVVVAPFECLSRSHSLFTKIGFMEEKGSGLAKSITHYPDTRACTRHFAAV